MRPSSPHDGSCLTFYPDHRLMELQFTRDNGPERAFILAGGRQPLWLNGSSGPIHEVNESESLEFSDQTVLDYIRFFFYFVRGDGGFVLIESPAELDAPAGAAWARWWDDTEMLALDEARGSVKPLELRSSGSWDGGSRMRPSRIRVHSSSARCRSALTG